MIHANGNEYAPYKAVERSTYGILFLGTPHQGSAAVDLAALILQILSIGFDTTDTILNDLGLHSKALQQQQDQYNQICLRYATKCYYEIYATKLPLGKRIKVGCGFGKVINLSEVLFQLVERPSAILPESINSQSVALNRDHVNICKFGNFAESDFKIVISHLSEMVGAAPSNITKKWKMHESLQGL